MAENDEHEGTAAHRVNVLHQHLRPRPAAARTPALNRAPLRATYDFVVVGAGSAGCVVASRLSEDPSVSVLLVEAGGSNQSFRVRWPMATCPTLQNSARDWAYRTAPQPANDGNVSFWPRGRTLGGSSSINYMLYVRGDPRNYDAWARDEGCAGWSYADVLPFFKKSENLVGRDDSGVGANCENRKFIAAASFSPSGQFCCVGVPRTDVILYSSSGSEEPGNSGRSVNSSAMIAPQANRSIGLL